MWWHITRASRVCFFVLEHRVAVNAIRKKFGSVRKVAIIDWDVHHGDGTQHLFREHNDVLFFSIHRFGDFFPGTGDHSEVRGVNLCS
jgi:acetoin utilization deacetylase AcuC-like enzyme